MLHTSTRARASIDAVSLGRWFNGHKTDDTAEIAEIVLSIGNYDYY